MKYLDWVMGIKLSKYVLFFLYLSIFNCEYNAIFFKNYFLCFVKSLCSALSGNFNLLFYSL